MPKEIRETIVENDFEAIKSFMSNPYNNIRDYDLQQIELSDEGVQLKSELTVKPDYRSKVNELLDKLISFDTDVDGNKTYYFEATVPFIVSPKNNKLYPGKAIIIDGNSRFNFLNQLIDLAGQDNVNFKFTYKVFKEWDEINTLISAPDMGFNSNIPVLKASAESVLDTAYEFILKNPTMLEEDQTPIEWVSNVVAFKKDRKEGKKGVNEAIYYQWSKVQKTPEWEPLKGLMNLEGSATLINFWNELSKNPQFLEFYKLTEETAPQKALEVIENEIKGYLEGVNKDRLTTKKNFQDVKSSIMSLFSDDDDIFESASNDVQLEGQPTDSLNTGVNIEVNSQPKINLEALAESSGKSEIQVIEDLFSETLDKFVTVKSVNWEAYDELEQSNIYAELLTIHKRLQKLEKLIAPNKPKTETEAETEAA